MTYAAWWIVLNILNVPLVLVALLLEISGSALTWCSYRVEGIRRRWAKSVRGWAA